MKQSSKIYEDHKHALNKFKINQIIFDKIRWFFDYGRKTRKGKPYWLFESSREGARMNVAESRE